MKTNKALQLLFVGSTALVVVGAFCYINKSSVRALNAQTNTVDHTIELNKTNICDVADDDGFVTFKLRKENSTRSGYYFETSEAFALDYSSFEYGNNHILVADQGSSAAYVDIKFTLEGIADFYSVSFYGKFYSRSDDEDPDITEKTIATFNYDNVVEAAFYYQKIILDRIVISYSCLA